MASYEPPSQNLPTFDSLLFQTSNNGSLTIAEGDARYLGRTNVATSIATATQFSGDISVGSSTLDYLAGTGLTIKGTANSESIFMNVLNGVGVTKQKVELNPNHIHLYDGVRITDSLAPTNYTLLQQSTTTLNIDNGNVNSTTINLKTRTSGGASVTPLSLSSTAVTMNLPMTIGYTVAPTSGQLGFITKTNGTAAGTAMVSGTFYNLITAGVSVPAGTYSVCIYVNISHTAVAGSMQGLQLGFTNNNVAFGGTGFSNIVSGSASISAVAGNIVGHLTQTLNLTATTTMYLGTILTFATIVPTTIPSTCYVQFTRIA